MSADALVDAARVGWLTLAFMMLFSRVAFQAKGPAWMRSFLDGWQAGGVKRLWGAVGLAYAAFLVVAALRVEREFGLLDVVVVGSLVAVLVADGLVNVLPSGFAAFKDRMQRAWIARRAGAGREDDRYLFGTVNAGLAAGSILVLVVVVAYRPIDFGLVAAAAGIGLALTLGLIALSLRTT